ncbi:MAG TPA: isoprenyl transferase [Firmicutes bacterium]|nr:isoprenyl transferase [Bacillota bacterium]
MAFFKSKSDHQAGSVDLDHLPRHIAIIMDGNGRWAKRRGLPRTAGHKVGAEVFRTIATYCKDLGIDYLTVYAFSTENWKRPKDEVDTIMRLLKRYLLEAIDTMARDNIRLRFLGDLTELPQELQDLAARTNAISATLDGFQANICLNYGGRDEILRAARQFARECAAGERTPEQLDTALFERHLFSAGLPDPDLIIRPGGEKRVSNFLLWQCAYAEFIFTDTLWPDFKKEDLDAALLEYQHRQRRYGGI